MDNKRNDLDFRRFFAQSRKFWWLYALCLLTLLIAAGIYASVRVPVYNSHAVLLIEESDNSGAAMAASKLNTPALSMLSLGGGSVNNEVILMNTNDLLSKVVAETKLNFTYFLRNGINKKLLFPDSPIELQVPREVLDTLTGGMKIRVELHNGKADIRATRGPFGIKTLAVVNNVALPYDLHTKVCNVRIAPAKGYDKSLDATIDVVLTGTPGAVEKLRKELSIETTEKKSNAVMLAYTDPDRARGCTVLDQIMAQYNSRRLERRRETSLNELEYCTDRLEKLYQQLTESEEKVETFKRNNNLRSLELDSASWVTRTIGARDKLAQSHNELTYYDQVLYTLNKDKGGDTFIPTAIEPGAKDNPLAVQYNDLVSQKRDLEISATPDNPVLKNLTDKIHQLRSDIITNFSQKVELNQRNLDAIYSLSDEARGKMQQLPGIERELTTLLRDKTIKNELYLYLLQRREAAELRLYQTDTNGFIIDRAHADTKPAPLKSVIAFVLAFVFGLLTPAFLTWLWLKWTNKVNSPLDVAFIGLDQSCVKQQKDSSNIRRLRTLLTADPDVKNIYTLDLSSRPGDTARLLLDSLTNIDINAVIVDPREDADKSNDTLLEKAFAARLREAEIDNRYTISEIPDPSSITDIIPLLDLPQSRLLVVVTAGKTRRKNLRKLLKGVMTDRIAVYILNKKAPAEPSAGE